MTLEIGVIGLGKMGGGIARRLARSSVRVVGYDQSAGVRAVLQQDSIEVVETLADVPQRLAGPRTLWLMLPAGTAVDQTLTQLSGTLAEGDVVIDGGNGHYRDAIRRCAELAADGIRFLDVGTSGGITGEGAGYCLMIGGDADIVESRRALFAALAPASDRGWGWVGPPGAGHFVKMVHNGIEYGLMQAYAEGFALLDAKGELEIDPAAVARLWRDGSVIRSWLLELIGELLGNGDGLASIAPFVEDSGEGRWAVTEAIDLDVAAPVITASLIQRIRSRTHDGFADRLLAALRQAFGGHDVRRSSGDA